MNLETLTKLRSNYFSPFLDNLSPTFKIVKTFWNKLKTNFFSSVLLAKIIETTYAHNFFTRHRVDF